MAMNPLLSKVIYIFVANNFDEALVVSCLCRLREEGYLVSLVGQTSGLVSGMHGLVIRPDCYLTRLESAELPDLVIVAGGEACAAQLMADPRIMTLIQTVLKTGRLVALLSMVAYSLFESLNLYQPSQAESLLVPAKTPASDFIEQIVRRVSS